MDTINRLSILLKRSFIHSDMANKNVKIAISFTVVALILIFIAFVSPYWLVFDGKLKNPKFLNLGK